MTIENKAPLRCRLVVDKKTVVDKIHNTFEMTEMKIVYRIGGKILH